MNKPSGTQEVLELFEAETQNFLANMEDAENAMKLFDHLWKLFDDAAQLFLKATTKKTDDPTAFAIQANLYQLMKMDLLRGILSLSRGYITDSGFHTRRLLETSAVMIELIRKPKKVAIYATLDDESARKKYIENFKIFLLVQNNLSEQSQKHYEMLCYQVHPSAIAVGQRGRFTDNRVHELDAFDVISEEDTPRLMKYYGLHMFMAFEALKGLKSAFTESELNEADWNKICDEFKIVWNSFAHWLVKIRALDELLALDDSAPSDETK